MRSQKTICRHLQDTTTTLRHVFANIVKKKVQSLFNCLVHFFQYFKKYCKKYCALDLLPKYYHIMPKIMEHLQ